ncbi:MAG: UbiA family prenyltransferase [Candidatus Marsarchaeota archaeon]|jgi:geranylgeranylglycerol-phosphate geranylgeranyltransferase|nr:UbiA family prenyltransferase [Candidatus Marsarchaeota archaeon]
MNKIIAFLKLTRIEHSLMLVVAVLAAELIAGGLPGHFVLAMSLITPIFVSMASFAINDYFDLETDRANGKKERPLVSGAISREGALLITAVTLFIGVMASAFINAYAFVIALVFGALAMLYSYRLKDMLLVGNSYIALSMVIPFIYGSFVVSDSMGANIIIVCFIIFLSGLAREIHGMMRDYRGDTKIRHSKNVVYYFGMRRSGAVALLLYIEAVALSIVLFFMYMPFAYNLVYAVPVAIVDALLLYVGANMTGKRIRAKDFVIGRNVSLASMGVALLAFLLSAIVYVHL